MSEDKLQAMAETAKAPADKAVEEKKIVEFEEIKLKVDGKIVTLTREDVEAVGLIDRWFFRRMESQEELLTALVYKLTR